MIVGHLILCSILVLITDAGVNKDQTLIRNIAVAEHPINNIITNNLNNETSKSTTEKTLIRVTRLSNNDVESKVEIRQRRDVDEDIDIFGMAKKVAITVFGLVLFCIVCCVCTTIYICVKCCGSQSDRKERNQSRNTIQPPIIIHTGQPNYQVPVQQTWALENHPMLPQPSAPPQPSADFFMERPPPYETVCTNK